jgi:hypothetical protein
MNKTTWMIFGLEIYALLFVLAVVGFGIWRRKRRKERPPVEFKLLRGPGESLRRRMQQTDDEFAGKILLIAVAPPIVASMATATLTRLSPKTPLLSLLAGAAVLAAGIALAAWLILRLMGRRRDDLLGYLGERAVAEELQPLGAEGYRVFHDLPVKEGDRTFNIDHVVVGPTGLFAVETKARRKGRAREGFKDHEVVYDGKQLIWPWAEDRYGLVQADAEARWLTNWIHKATGLSVTARAILALPGWFVVNRVYGPILVVNHKGLPSFIHGRGERILSEEQIDLIARQLDQRCRDVED